MIEARLSSLLQAASARKTSLQQVAVLLFVGCRRLPTECERDTKINSAWFVWHVAAGFMADPLKRQWRSAVWRRAVRLRQDGGVESRQQGQRRHKRQPRRAKLVHLRDARQTRPVVHVSRVVVGQGGVRTGAERQRQHRCRRTHRWDRLRCGLHLCCSYMLAVNLLFLTWPTSMDWRFCRVPWPRSVLLHAVNKTHLHR